MAFYQQLVAATEAQRQELYSIPFIQAGVAGELTLEEYVAFLGQAYHHVKHTVPLLMACGSRLGPRYEWLRKAVAEYIEEEYGHEEWILNDIRNCGADSEAVRHDQPMLATEIMVSYAYDMIQRVNPLGFFGMVQVLEGTSVEYATMAAEAIQKKLGLPKNAFAYLTSHGALDIEHVDFFRSLMDRIDDESDQRAIVHCARVFYKLYGDIFRHLPFEYKEDRKHAVAG